MSNTKIVLIVLEIEDFDDACSDYVIEQAVEDGISELMLRRGIAELHQLNISCSFD